MGNSENSGWLYFGGSKITADGDCSHEIKRCLLLGRKVMTKLDSILKSRDITLPTKVRLVKTMVFPVVMYGCESQTVKKAERWRIDAFKLWCWRRLFILGLLFKEKGDSDEVIIGWLSFYTCVVGNVSLGQKAQAKQHIGLPCRIFLNPKL